jgi:hypothetical protein
MSYFAAFHEQPERLVVRNCHINIWLSSNRWRQQCLFDVGLALLAKEGTTDSPTIRIALPFKATECEDLEPLLHDVGTASLVFNDQMGVTRQAVGQRLKGERVDFLLSSCSSKRDSEFDKADGCVWEVKPHAPIENVTPTYVRIRFRVPSKALWKADRARGVLLDFRIADTREALVHEKWKSLSKFVQIQNLNVFVIAPSFWGVESNNPEFSVRVLEREVWRKYLGEYCTAFSGPMLVRHWKRYTPEQPIDPKRPFAAFLQLRESMQDKLSRTVYYLILATVIITTIVVLKARDGVVWIVDSWSATQGFVEKSGLILKITGVAGALHVAITALRNFEWVRDRVLAFFKSRKS